MSTTEIVQAIRQGTAIAQFPTTEYELTIRTNKSGTAIEHASMPSGYTQRGALGYLTHFLVAGEKTSLEEMCRVAEGRLSPSGMKKTKKRMYELRMDAPEDYNYIILPYYDGRSVTAVKVYDHESADDREHLKAQLEDQIASGELRASHARKIAELGQIELDFAEDLTTGNPALGQGPVPDSLKATEV